MDPAAKGIRVVGDEHTYDPAAMLSWDPLKELLGSLTRQLSTQQQQIDGLRGELEVQKAYAEGLKRDLRQQIDLKAGAKDVSSLALEVGKETIAVAKRFQKTEEDLLDKLKRIDQRAEVQAGKISDVRAGLDNKAEALTLHKLAARVDLCATASEISSVHQSMKQQVLRPGSSRQGRSQGGKPALPLGRVPALPPWLNACPPTWLSTCPPTWLSACPPTWLSALPPPQTRSAARCVAGARTAS